MIRYLSGVVRPSLVGLRDDLGLMLTPVMGNRPNLSATAWAGDNACFSSPDKFTLDGFLAWLEGMREYRKTCLFAVAPDIVGNAVATWERSAPALPLIRRLGFPAAFVAQDGQEGQPVRWTEFDVLFIGGSTAWKLSHHARDLTAEAKRHGKQVHMGRVNSLRRLSTAAMWGCDSADGTFLARAPDHNTPRMLAWLDQLQRAPMLCVAAAGAEGIAA